MDEFMQRVLREKEDLQDKISKLDAFLASTEKPILLPGEINRLRAQRDVMSAYEGILNMRISAYEESLK